METQQTSDSLKQYINYILSKYVKIDYKERQKMAKHQNHTSNNEPQQYNVHIKVSGLV